MKQVVWEATAKVKMVDKLSLPLALMIIVTILILPLILFANASLMLIYEPSQGIHWLFLVELLFAMKVSWQSGMRVGCQWGCGTCGAMWVDSRDRSNTASPERVCSPDPSTLKWEVVPSNYLLNNTPERISVSSFDLVFADDEGFKDYRWFLAVCVCLVLLAAFTTLAFWTLQIVILAKCLGEIYLRRNRVIIVMMASAQCQKPFRHSLSYSEMKLAIFCFSCFCTSDVSLSGFRFFARSSKSRNRWQNHRDNLRGHVVFVHAE